MALGNGGGYHKFLLEKSERDRSSALSVFPVFKLFEALLFFHAIGTMSTALQEKSLRISQVYSNGALIELHLPMIEKVWCILFEEAFFQRLSNAIARTSCPMMSSLCWNAFEASRRLFVLAPEDNAEVGLGSPLKGGNGVDEHVIKQSAATCEARHHFSYLLFYRPLLPRFRYNHYHEGEKWVVLS